MTFTRTAAALNAYAGGQLTLERRRRTTCACRWWCGRWRWPRRREVSGDRYSVTFGYDGAFTRHAARAGPGGDHRRHGRRRPDRQHLLADLAERAADPRHRAGRHDAMRASRCSMPTSAPAPTSTCACSTAQRTLVGSSGSGTSAEEVEPASTRRPAPTRSSCRAGAWSAASPFRLHTWLLGSATPAT